MMVLPVSVASTEQSRPDCAVSIDTWSHSAAGQFGQERVAGRAVVDDRRVAEAQVHGGGAGDPRQRPVDRGHAVLAGLLRAGLQVGLVQLDDVGPGREQVL